MNILQLKYNADNDKIRLLAAFTAMMGLGEITGKIEGQSVFLNTDVVPFYTADHYCYAATIFLIQASRSGHDCVQIML